MGSFQGEHGSVDGDYVYANESPAKVGVWRDYPSEVKQKMNLGGVSSHIEETQYKTAASPSMIQANKSMVDLSMSMGSNLNSVSALDAKSNTKSNKLPQQKS